MEWLLSWKLIAGAVMGFLGVVYGLVQRRDRRRDLRDAVEAKVLLRRAHEDFQRLEAQNKKLREPLPTDIEFADSLRGL